MIPLDFEGVCEGVISPFGEEIASQSFSAPNSMGVITFGPNWQRGLHDAYEDWRNVAHGLMLDPSMLIDRHKVAAAMVLAILEFNPLVAHLTNRDGKFLILSRLANEVLAFNVGMAMVIEFAIADAEKEKDFTRAKALERPVVFPPSSVEGSSYRAQTYRAFYQLRRLERIRIKGDNPLRGVSATENFLILSNLFFSLEQYNLQAQIEPAAA